MTRANLYFSFGVLFGLVFGALLGACLFSLVEFNDPMKPLELLGPPPSFLIGAQEDPQTTVVVTLSEVVAEKQVYIRHLEKENEQLEAALRLLMGGLEPQPTPAKPPVKPSVGKNSLDS